MVRRIVHTIKRRLAFGWSSLVGVKKSKQARVRSVRQFRLRVSRRKVVLIKLRTFRTARQRRSKRLRQIVFPVVLGRFREIAVILQTSVYVKSPPKTYVITVRIRPSSVVNYMVISLWG